MSESNTKKKQLKNSTITKERRQYELNISISEDLEKLIKKQSERIKVTKHDLQS